MSDQKTLFTSNEFGTSINPEEILDTFEFLDDWEDRYAYIIDLGKKLPTFPEDARIEENKVHGCQSQVWISHSYNPEQQNLCFSVDSDAHIVRGLAAMVMAAFNYKTPQQILDFDIQDYFGKTQLIQHLSPTRGNGLQSMVNTIKASASQHL